MSQRDAVCEQVLGTVDSLDVFLEQMRSDPLGNMIQDGIVVIDMDRNVRLMNRCAQELLGISESEAIGQPCCDILRSDVCGDKCDHCLHQPGTRFMENFNIDFQPANNGIHDKAFNAIQDLIKKGKQALDLFWQVAQGDFSVPQNPTGLYKSL